MNELLDALSGHGFSVPNLELHSKLIRFDRQGKRSGWFVGFENKTKKGETYIVAVYGDWKTGERYEHRTKRDYTKAQDREILGILRESQREVELEREKLQKIAKRDAQNRWDDGGSNLNVPYLSRKGIPSLYGCRSTLGNDGRVLLVPMRDSAGELWGLQTISSDGSKRFLSGQRINGLFHTVHNDASSLNPLDANPSGANPLDKLETIYIAEGFSTAASVHQAIGKPVVCAFNAQNLIHVAKDLKELYPTASFVICGDDDQFTTRVEKDGAEVPYNPGRKYGELAADACAGVVAFPVFQSLEALPTDFNDLHIMEGLETLKEQILGSPEPTKQYVLCLGFSEDKYFYTSAQNKHIKALSVNGHNKVALLSLMDLGYWDSLYPSKGQDGVDWTAAINDLMSKCRKKGPFNLNNVRATGAWLGDKKELVLNRGDCIIVGGEKKGFHSLKSRYIYEPGNLILPEPSPDFLSNGQCGDFLETLNMLSWAHKDYYKFLAGWLMIAPVCGALEWRPHIWLSGPSGSGKSTVMNEVVHRLLRPTGVFYQGQSTEAGIRQSLGKKALPVVFDEFETNDEKSGIRIAQIVELIRQASYETDAFIVKGSADGTSVNYLPRFCTIVSAVNVNLTFEADKNRFTVIELARQLGDMTQSVQNFQAFQKRMEMVDDAWVQGWYSRIFGLWDVFTHNRDLLFDVISKRHNARMGQQYGALLAGFAICEQSNPLSRDHAEHLVDDTDLEMKSKEQDDADETECLAFLLSKKVFINGSISRDTNISSMIDAVSSFSPGKYAGSQAEWEGSLKLYGMSIKDRNLLVPNNHPEINSLLKGTKWCGIYDRSLKRIKGADNNDNKPIKVAGSSRKCTRIPLDAIELPGIPSW